MPTYTSGVCTWDESWRRGTNNRNYYFKAWAAAIWCIAATVTRGGYRVGGTRNAATIARDRYELGWTRIIASSVNGEEINLGNGQKREYPVLFWPKTDVPENNSGREWCWPYLIGQHPLSPVFGQKRPGNLGNSYFAQLPPVFGDFMFRFWPTYVPFRWATRLLEQINMGHKDNEQQISVRWSGNFIIFCKQFWG